MSTLGQGNRYQVDCKVEETSVHACIRKKHCSSIILSGRGFYNSTEHDRKRDRGKRIPDGLRRIGIKVCLENYSEVL